MADIKERKRVTLHPLKEDGTMDLEINLYPKTLVNGIVDEDGNEVDIATQAELDEAVNNISAELGEKTTEIADIKQNILYVESDILAAKQDITGIHEDLETKAAQEDLNIAVANIEQEIQDLPKGDVTEEELQNVVSTLENQIDTKASQEDLEELATDVTKNISEAMTSLYASNNNWTGRNYFNGGISTNKIEADYLSIIARTSIYGDTYFHSNIYTGNIMTSTGQGITGTFAIGTSSYHYGSAYIDTLYGIGLTSKPVSQIALITDLANYATTTDLSNAVSSLQTSIASCVTLTELSTTLQSYATVAALDEYGATEVLSGTFSSIFASVSELDDRIIDIAFDSTIYALVYSIASYPDAKFVKQRLEILTEDRPILLDRFTRGSSAIYCDFNYRGIYGKIDCLAHIYSIDNDNYCDLDTTYGIYTINLNLK